MQDKPSINRLPGDRLHLRHGPIAIVLRVWAAPDVVRQAHRLVTRHFPKILPELEDEMDEMRLRLQKGHKFQGKVAQRMADAMAPFGGAPVTARAGAVADEVLRIVVAAGAIERAYVVDGSDIAFHLAPGFELTYGAGGDVADPSPQALAGNIKLIGGLQAGGLAVAGGQRHAASLGIADTVTVLAKTAAGAAAAAAAIAGTVDIESKAITRKAASKVDADTSLGDALVATKVGRLTSGEIETALSAGVAAAEAALAKGLIAGAVLALQGESKTVGIGVAGLHAKR